MILKNPNFLSNYSSKDFQKSNYSFYYLITKSPKCLKVTRELIYLFSTSESQLNGESTFREIPRNEETCTSFAIKNINQWPIFFI